MGSLMAGWSSQVLDSETVLLKRNKSLTREEIDSFRRAQKPSREEEEEYFTSDAAALTSPTSSSPQEKDRARAKQTTFMGFPDDASDVVKTGDWWTRSNWAFLNEPPRDELSDSAHKYTAQFHVAHLAVDESA